MDTVDHGRMRQAIAALDARLRRLSQAGGDLSGPRMIERLRARAEEMRRQQGELTAAQLEADRLLPEMLDFYINGGDADRQWMRDQLSVHKSFRWGVGWDLVARVATEDDARKALAVLSMKDGGSDYRDQTTALDHLCRVMGDAGLEVAVLLTEAAAWSSDVARFPAARSTRSLLLERAQRFAG